MKRIIFAAMTMAIIAPAGAAPKLKHIVQFKEGAPVTIDPGKAYILYRTNVVAKAKSDLLFMRDLTPAEIQEYEAAQAKATAKRDARELSSLNTTRAAKGMKPLAALPPRPAGKPQPPEIPYLKNGVPNVVRVAGNKALIKGVDERTYLLQVPAGTYLIVGQSPTNMVGGTCMCMGSVRFETKTGQVTDLGHVLAAPEDAAIAPAEFKGLAFDPDIKVTPWNVTVRPAAATLARPASLANTNVVAASYVPAEKFPNFFGMLINRMPVIPGVLAYDGDKAVKPAAQPSASGS